MPNSIPLLLLPPAARSPCPAPCPRLTRGSSACRVLTTAAMLAEIGEAPAPITAAQALNSLSTAVDQAVAQGQAA